MKPKSYDELSPLEKSLYHEAIHSEGYRFYRRPVPYSYIEDIRDAGWICTISGEMLHPYYYYPAPLAHHLDSIEGTNQAIARQEDKLAALEPPINSLPTKRIDDHPLVLLTKKTASFGGQDQDNVQLSKETPTTSVFGEFWIEIVYKKIKGQTYGPYRVKRWRDENGRKRSRYLGKAPTEKPSAPKTAAAPTETTAPDSPA
jgi:hypothetical protein